MGYFLLKTGITALIVAAVSEIARRSTVMAALLASLPLTSVLAFVWTYRDTQDAEKIAALSMEVFWLVIPSLAFFLLLPWLIRYGMPFWSALGLSCVGTAIGYGIFVGLRSVLH